MNAFRIARETVLNWGAEPRGIRKTAACMGGIIVVFSMMCGHVRAQQISANFKKPVALGYSPSIGVAVLGLDGTISVFSGDGSNFQQIRSFTVASKERPSDLLIGRVGEQAYIFVVSIVHGGPTSSSKVTQYNISTGRSVSHWTVSGLAAGMCFDEKNRLIYVNTYDVNRLYSIQVDLGGSAPQLVGDLSSFKRMPSLGQAGAMSFDAAGDRIWIGDAYSGNLYIYDLKMKNLVRVPIKNSSADGVFVDNASDRVYIADRRQREIDIVDRHSKQLLPPAIGITPPGMLRSPVAVAAIGDSQIAVADEDKNTVLFLAKDGRLVFTIDGRP